jgi:hypothetical protein
MHNSEAMELAGEFDLIHNHFDFAPLTYSRLIETPIVTTIHGFSSAKILPVYQKYADIGEIRPMWYCTVRMRFSTWRCSSAGMARCRQRTWR